MHEISDLLHFAEHTLQEVALGFMALVYITRITWFLKRFKAGKERQAETGRPGTTKAKGILYSWANVAMPWAMESSRTNLLMWLQFALFHMGVTSAILLSFVIPYAPKLLEIGGVVPVLQVIIAGAFIVGIVRIIRRVGSK